MTHNYITALDRHNNLVRNPLTCEVIEVPKLIILPSKAPDSTVVSLYDTPVNKDRPAPRVGVIEDTYKRTRNLKSDFVLENNALALIQKFGIDCIGFFTLTFSDKVYKPREASRRFNSFCTHAGKKLFRGGIFVKEVHKDGSLHLHGLVACHSDIRTGFNWAKVRAGQYRYANKNIRSIWKSLRGDKFARKGSKLERGICASYGFGRHNLEPVENAIAVTKYISSYLSKGYHAIATDFRFKGVRMVNYIGKGWRTTSLRFQWIGGKSREWRLNMKRLAKSCKIKENDYKFMAWVLNMYMDLTWEGPRKEYKWAYWFTKAYDADFKNVAFWYTKTYNIKHV